MSYNLKKAVDMQRMARFNFGISPANWSIWISKKRQLITTLCLMHWVNQSKQVSCQCWRILLATWWLQSRFIVASMKAESSLNSNCGITLPSSIWFIVPIAKISLGLRKLWRSAAYMDKCNKDEMFSVLLGKSVAVAASTRCTGGPLRELTHLAKQYEFNWTNLLK